MSGEKFTASDFRDFLKKMRRTRIRKSPVLNILLAMPDAEFLNVCLAKYGLEEDDLEKLLDMLELENQMSLGADFDRITEKYRTVTIGEILAVINQHQN
jgi:hypothetical protein